MIWFFTAQYQFIPLIKSTPTIELKKRIAVTISVSSIKVVRTISHYFN
jgi:hypothetical protein